MLGVRAHLGQLIFPDDVPDTAGWVVVSYPFWRRLGADPRLVGTTIHLGEYPVTVIGVAPATFGRMLLVWEPDVWMRFKTAQQVVSTPPRMLTDRRQRWLHLIGRLKPGVSGSQARTDVQLLSSRIERDHPATDKGRSAILTATTMVPASDRAWTSLLSGALLIIVLLVLIVACANVTNLLLGLSTSRRHEMLVRAALGASRLHLAMPLLRESALLALISGALGYAAAYAGLAELSALQAAFGSLLPSIPPPSIDSSARPVVMAGAFVAVIVAGVAVGMAPAWRAASDGVAGALNRESSAGEPRKARLRSVLVVIQMAVATLVLVGVGVSIRSLKNLERVPLGFSARNLVFTGVDVRRSGLDERTGPAFYERIRREWPTMPDIDAVSLVESSRCPALAATRSSPKAAPPPAATAPRRRIRSSTTVLLDPWHRRSSRPHVRLPRQAGAPEVVVINATMARQHWPGGDPSARRCGSRTATVSSTSSGSSPTASTKSLRVATPVHVPCAGPALPAGHHGDRPHRAEPRPAGDRSGERYRRSSRHISLRRSWD